MPAAARLALLVAVAALAAVILSTVTGVLPRVVDSVGGAVSGLAGKVLVSPSPAPTSIRVPPPPTLVAPRRPYTNQPAVTLAGTVPEQVTGHSGYIVRIYVALPDSEPVAVRDVAVGETPSFTVADLPLEKGRNDVSATIVGPGGESDPSPVVTVVRDVSKPTLTISTPKNGATINSPTATVTGKTQASSAVVARNEANGSSASTTADGSGRFSVKVALAAGQNAIALTATDPAGNVGTAVVTVRRGSGHLTVALTASAYRLSAAGLPKDVELRAVVTNPDGAPLANQTVTFTLTIPGVPALTGDALTDASGMAKFRTTIPAGATIGSGLGTAFVSVPILGDASGRVSLTITK